MKTAFIYDKWYSTLGGGEVVASHLALTLHQLGYQTTIISGFPVSLEKIQTIQGLDLSSINFAQSFNDQLKINLLTSGADIFINCSFWDYSTSLAKKNYYYCFFPSPLKNQTFKKILTSLIQPYERITDHQYLLYELDPQTNYRLKFSIQLPYFTKLILQKYQPILDNAKIISSRVYFNHSNNKIYYQYQYQPLTNSITINSLGPISLYRYPFQNKIFSLLRSGTFFNQHKNISKFDKIFATSNFVKYWIKRYWHINATTLYPPVPLLSPGNSPRKNQICSIGRFTKKGNNKKHEIMILAFKKLVDNGLLGWELHLAGGLGQEPSSQQYAQSLQQQIGNYPIYLHFSPSRKELEKMLHHSKIYWHAAGFGLNKNRHPEQFEHFGITPLEGISAGCLPIVFQGGGLTEIITVSGLDENKHTFGTIEELITRTNYLINNNVTFPPHIHQTLSINFSIAQFHKNLEVELSKID